MKTFMKLFAAFALALVGVSAMAEGTKTIYGDWERDTDGKGCTRVYVTKLGTEVVDKGFRFTKDLTVCGGQQAPVGKVVVSEKELCSSGVVIKKVVYSDNSFTKTPVPGVSCAQPTASLADGTTVTMRN